MSLTLMSLHRDAFTTGTLESLSAFVDSEDCCMECCEAVIAVDAEGDEVARWKRNKDGKLVRFTA